MFVQERSVDPARADAIDPNAILCKLHRRALGQMDNPCLGDTVDQRSSLAEDAGNRGRRNDRTASVLAHVRNRVLDAEEHCAEQHREGAIPVVSAYLFQWSQRPCDSRVIVNDVKAAEFVNRPLDRRLDFGFTFDAGFLEDRAAALLSAITYRGFAS